MNHHNETGETQTPPRRTRRIVAVGATAAALAGVGAGIAAIGNGGEQEVVSAGQAANQEARSPQAAQVQADSQEVSEPQVNAAVQGETSSTVEVPASIAPVQRAAAPETTVPTAANQAPKPEQQTNREMSLQQQEAYGDELLRQSRAGARPLVGAECGSVMYYMNDKGEEVQVNNAAFASKTPGEEPSASVPDNKKFFMQFVEKVGPDGKVIINPDGTPEYRTEVFTPTREEKLPHAALDTCLVRIEKLGDYGNRPVGEIISDNPSSNGLRIEIGSSYTGPNTAENQEGETLHVSLDPEPPTAQTEQQPTP